MSLTLADATTASLASSKSSNSEEDNVITLQPATSCAIRQKSISITLDGPSIFTISLTIVFLIHYLGTRLTEILVIATPFLLMIRNDYENFLGLGPGGTPSTFQGYLVISWWRIWSIRDPFTAPKTNSSSTAQKGIFNQQAVLPYRSGPRPRVAGIAPQRQVDQLGSRQCYLALRRAMERLGDRNPLKFGTERSCLEKHGLALFAKHALRTNCQGEICHVHDSDHSMHMCLHPDDIQEVLSKGWGQRHPLARNGWLLQMPVSPNFVMIYAPRNEHELQITYRIIEAAIWYTLAENAALT